MNFSVENPKVFYLFILLFGALFYSVLKFKKLSKSFSENNSLQRQIHAFVRFKRCFVFRTIFRSLMAVMIIFALAGISWGTNLLPVQKNGRAVSFVFDISYSMEATDCPDGMTRLDAASKYAQELLNHLDGAKVSVVIAKGEGSLAVPLTEDFFAVRTILQNLSPKLMTSVGTSLGKGINTAISSFPSQSSEANYIWLFTDGEETDNSLQDSLSKAVKSGIPVVVIGFGSERETEILAGDGKTKIKTALRSSSIEKILSSVQKKKTKNLQGQTANALTYVDASEMGSAYKIIKMLMMDEQNSVLTYEAQTVPRHSLFIVLAIVFYMASFLFGEMDIQQGKKKLLSSVSSAIIFGVLFTGCSAHSRDGTKLLEGNINWQRKNYQKAVASFLEVKDNAHERGDFLTEDYALYGLATTYLMQNETEAAMARYSQISKDAPDNIKFAVFYNSGIIAHRNGDYDLAAEFFKNALLINSSNTNAKINMELSLQENSVQENVSQENLDKVNVQSDDKILQNELYSIIRETEQTQWKNQESNSESTDKDY